MDYTADDVLRVARRHRNEKRSYLLVNPLQGKHMPVAPGRALAMMKALGEKVAAAHPAARLVIGFAETATAIGAVVANALAPSCLYLQTTREKLAQGEPSIDFLEEHSHAPEQRLALAALEAQLSETDTVVFVDDELSTGRTLANIVEQLQRTLPALGEKKLVAASILNRLTAEDTERLRARGVECIALVKLAPADYETQAAGFMTRAAADCRVPSRRYPYRTIALGAHATPRTGVAIRDYGILWQGAGLVLADRIAWAKHESILVLGTEECMLPGLLVGRVLEQKGWENVFFHATTRSPIGISDAAGYPIEAGWQIRSFYDEARATYIYNLRPYHHAVIVSDTECEADEAVESLARALRESGCTDIVYLMSRDE